MRAIYPVGVGSCVGKVFTLHEHDCNCHSPDNAYGSMNSPYHMAGRCVYIALGNAPLASYAMVSLSHIEDPAAARHGSDVSILL
jgi:hypothetical protein